MLSQFVSKEKRKCVWDRVPYLFIFHSLLSLICSFPPFLLSVRSWVQHSGSGACCMVGLHAVELHIESQAAFGCDGVTPLAWPGKCLGVSAPSIRLEPGLPPTST